jgi:hypothetical protein
VVVPEDRSWHKRPRILLPVGVLRSRAAPDPEPTIHFAGGPGDDALSSSLVRDLADVQFAGAEQGVGDPIVFPQSNEAGAAS